MIADNQRVRLDRGQYEHATSAASSPDLGIQIAFATIQQQLNADANEADGADPGAPTARLQTT
jgi:glycine cleavage system aminomethyltransferase T